MCRETFIKIGKNTKTALITALNKYDTLRPGQIEMPSAILQWGSSKPERYKD